MARCSWPATPSTCAATSTTNHLPHRTEDDHLYRRSLREVQQYVRETPDAVVIPGHDWDAWQALEPAY